MDMDMAIPAIGEGKRGLDGYLFYLLRQANAAALQAIDRELERIGISFAQYSALTMINAYEGISSADLSRISMLTPQSISETVSRLENGLMIERSDDPNHGRVQLLTVTNLGRHILDQAKLCASDVERQMKRLAIGLDEKALKQWLVQVATTLAEE